MNRRWCFSLCCIMVGASSAVALADQVIVEKVNYPNVRIVGFEGGRIQFQENGTLHKVWIDRVDRLAVGRGGPFVDFNDAERFLAEGRPGDALVRYRRAYRRTAGYWRDLIDARRLAACVGAGRFEQTALTFVRLVRSRRVGVVAAHLIPEMTVKAKDADLNGALRTLEDAVRTSPDAAQRAVLQMFLYDLRSRSGLASKNIRDAVAVLVLPESARFDRTYAIQLSAIAEFLQERPSPDRLAGLDRFMLTCPDSLLPRALLLKGESLLATAKTREQLIRASWAFLRVVIHMPQDPAAPQALLGAARVLDRLGRPDKAIELARQCVAHKKVTEATRSLAQAELTRLQGDGSGNGGNSRSDDKDPQSPTPRDQAGRGKD